ncbi:hypothetical protein AMECASPLE_022036 [Ameca splendens]|uniref:Secreted protein n=1 Tax=Ameca splendens TaxID=208324 RepID=A0ABV0ZCK1_9TELE
MFAGGCGSWLQFSQLGANSRASLCLMASLTALMYSAPTCMPALQPFYLNITAQPAPLTLELTFIEKKISLSGHHQDHELSSE